MKKLITLIAFAWLAVGWASASTWFVRPDGGTRHSSNMAFGQCDGTADVSYVSTGATTNALWQPSTSYPSGSTITASDGHYWVSNGLTSDSSPTGPNWAGGSPASDNGGTWEQGLTYPVNQHCAFGQYQWFWSDGSFVTNPGFTFPGWGWIGAGGDTYKVRGKLGDGVFYPVGWWTNFGNPVSGPAYASAQCVAGICYGFAGQPQSSGGFAPSAINGTSGAHTVIEGECADTNTCDAKNSNTLTGIVAGGGVDNVVSLYGTNYVDFIGFDITDHAHCDFQSVPTAVACKDSGGSTQYPYGKNGIQFFNTTTNTTIQHVRVHGIAANGTFGATGDGVTFTDFQVWGNGAAGINMDDGSGQTGIGSLSFTNYGINWNGCMEEWPIVDSVPYDYCRDQSTGGYGDGFGTASNDSLGNWNIVFDQGIVSYNTQDGLDALHICCAGSTMTITRTLAYGSEGNQFKVGGATATIQNDIVMGNCEALTSGTPIPGRPIPTNDSLGAPCRGGNTAIIAETTPGYVVSVQDLTCYEGGAICLDFEYATGDQGSTNVAKVNNMVFVGFFNAGAGSYPSRIYSTTDLNMLSNPGSSFTNNATLHDKSTCPYSSETLAVCGDPGLVDETYPIYGFANTQVASGASAVVGAGTNPSGISPIDFAGATRNDPQTIGAYEWAGGSSGVLQFGGGIILGNGAVIQ